LLRTYSQLFDDGNEDMALPMATALRVLLHDTKQSYSIFEQLNAKNTVHFTDTAHPIVPGQSAAFVRIGVVKGVGRIRCSLCRAGAPPSRFEQTALPFDKWWNRQYRWTSTDAGGLAGEWFE
jgi:hypothetical protein